MVWYFLFFLVIVLFGCVSEKDYPVSVSVTDSYGNAVENARVSFSPASENGVSLTGYTDASGNFASNLLPGAYTVVVTRQGYFSSVLENVIVPGNSSVVIRLEQKE